MKIVIVEDEKPAADMLQLLIGKHHPTMQVIAVLKTIDESINWFRIHSDEADLIFMDIHLPDGLSFEIFNRVNIQKPVIFTTAYDEYALEAFKVNSIDYILKPVKPSDLERSLQKIKAIQLEWMPLARDFYSKLLKLVPNRQAEYLPRILVRIGEHIKSVKTEEIWLFYAEGRTVYLLTREKNRYIADQTLEDLVSMLNPSVFFRCSRTFIANINAISDVVVYSGSRLKIRLNIPFEEDIFVSRERVGAFKTWFGGSQL